MPEPGPDPMEDRGHYVVAVSTAMMVLSGLAIVLRFLSRRLAKVPLLADDWLILASLPIAWALCATNIYGVMQHSLGRHLIAITSEEALVNFFKALMANELCNLTCLLLIKSSIILFYWRIFHLQGLKIPFVALGIVVSDWYIAVFFTIIFSCNPVRDFWSLNPNKTCINLPRFFLASAIPNITTDIILLVIPMPLLVRLNINTSQKIIVIGIFLLGSFVAVVSTLRLVYILPIQNSKDFTWDFVSVATWSATEVNTGIICACLPSLRPLLTLAMKGTLKKTTAPGHATPALQTISKRQWPRSMSKSEGTSGFTYLHDLDNHAKWGGAIQVYANEVNEHELAKNVPLQEVRVHEEATVE